MNLSQTLRKFILFKLTPFFRPHKDHEKHRRMFKTEIDMNVPIHWFVLTLAMSLKLGKNWGNELHSKVFFQIFSVLKAEAHEENERKHSDYLYDISASQSFQSSFAREQLMISDSTCVLLCANKVYISWNIFSDFYKRINTIMCRKIQIR